MATATYIPIATQTLGSAAASITFSSIPSTYTDLRLVLTCTTSAVASIYLQFNSDTGTNYSNTYLAGSGAAVGGNSTTSTTAIKFASAGAATSTTIPQLYSADIFSYAGSTNKSVLGIESQDYNGSGYVVTSSGLWRSTSAITTIVLSLSSGNFATGTIATLWGI